MGVPSNVHDPVSVNGDSLWIVHPNTMLHMICHNVLSQLDIVRIQDFDAEAFSMVNCTICHFWGRTERSLELDGCFVREKLRAIVHWNAVHFKRAGSVGQIWLKEVGNEDSTAPRFPQNGSQIVRTCPHFNISRQKSDFSSQIDAILCHSWLWIAKVESCELFLTRDNSWGGLVTCNDTSVFVHVSHVGRRDGNYLTSLPIKILINIKRVISRIRCQ